MRHPAQPAAARAAEVDAAFAHARQICVPALLWAAVFAAAMAVAALQDVPDGAAAQPASPEAVQIVPYGA